MEILSRFIDIMSCNIHDLVKKANNPEKMINETLRALQRDLNSVKAETAAFIAQENRAKREFLACQSEANKLERYASKSIKRGNEEEARTFLMKRSEIREKERERQQAYDLAASNARQMKQLHTKLSSDIQELEKLKGRQTAAKYQIKRNHSHKSLEEIEDYVNFALDEAEALAELRKTPTDDITKRTVQYDNKKTIDQELTELKKKLNKND